MQVFIRLRVIAFAHNNRKLGRYYTMDAGAKPGNLHLNTLLGCKETVLTAHDDRFLFVQHY